MSGSVRIAAAAYPVEALADWEALAAKLDRWAGEAAEGGAAIALFPEYAGMEAALLDGARAESMADWCLRAAAAADSYARLCSDLARRHGLWLLAGSMPEHGPDGLVNRARLHAPEGEVAVQDKQILTPWERAHTPLVAGAPLNALETAFGRVGILICYDSEFPALAAAQRPDILLVPSCTEALAGQTRVQVAARARALEGQCVVAQAPLLGGVPHCELIDAHRGQAGLFGPPDHGFPETGILALGESDSPGWVIGHFDPAALRIARTGGAVATLRDRAEAESCAKRASSRRHSPKRP